MRAKQRILRNQEASDWAVIGVDDEHGRRLFDQLARAGRQRVLPVAVGRSLARGVYVEGGRLYDTLAALGASAGDAAGAPVADLNPIMSLRGAHNWQNAAAAYAMARALASRQDRRRWSRPLEGSPTAWSWSRHRAACSSSTTARPPTPGRSACVGELRPYPLDRRGRPSSLASTRCCPGSTACATPI